MIILDTDHVTVLPYADHPRCAALVKRLEESGHEPAITVITWEEQLRGWLAEVARHRSFRAQVPPYARLLALKDFHDHWRVLPFDLRAAEEAERLRKLKLRLGSQDLKIAAIALAHEALLLSANLRDFKKVPGLLVENWVA